MWSCYPSKSLSICILVETVAAGKIDYIKCLPRVLMVFSSCFSRLVGQLADDK